MLEERVERARLKETKKNQVGKAHLKTTTEMILKERSKKGSVRLEKLSKDQLVSLWLVLVNPQNKKVPNKKDLISALTDSWNLALSDYQASPISEEAKDEDEGRS